MPAVGSWKEAFSYGRGTPVAQGGENEERIERMEKGELVVPRILA